MVVGFPRGDWGTVIWQLSPRGWWWTVFLGLGQDKGAGYLFSGRVLRVAPAPLAPPRLMVSQITPLSVCPSSSVMISHTANAASACVGSSSADVHSMPHTRLMPKMYHASCGVYATPLSKQHSALVPSISSHLLLLGQGAGVPTHNMKQPPFICVWTLYEETVQCLTLLSGMVAYCTTTCIVQSLRSKMSPEWTRACGVLCSQLMLYPPPPHSPLRKHRLF